MKFGRKIVATVVILVGVLSWAVPSGAEIDSFGEKTWGVYGLATGTQTDAIQNQVWAIEQIDNRIYVGGRFLEVRKNKSSPATSQPFIAAFDANTGEFVSSFRPAFDGAVYSLQASPDGSKLFVGGEFGQVNGDTEARALVALDPISGAVDTSWRSKARNVGGARGIIYSIDTNGRHLYVGGRFDSLGGGPRQLHRTTGAGRLSLTTGEADQSFTVSATGGAVWGIAIAPDSSKVYLAGHQTAVDGDPRGGYYSVLSASNGKLIPSLSNYVGNSSRQYGQDVVAVGNLVFWGGSEHVVNVYNATTGQLVRKHSSDRGGDFQDLEVVGNRVYASCHCYTNHWADIDWWAAGRPPAAAAPAGVSVNPLKYVAAYSATSAAYIGSFQLDVSAKRAGVWAIHGSPDGCLWVGGDLTRVTMENGNNRSLGGFTKFCDSANLVDSQAPTTPAQLTQTRQEKAKVVLRWKASSDNVGVAKYEVRRNGQLVGTKDAGRPATYWFTDRSLSPATSYNYQVIAVDAAGNRSPAARVSASTSGDAVISAPAGLRSTLQTKERIVLNWNKVSGASSYVIERSIGGGAFSQVGTKSNRWFTDRSVSSGTTYRYRVRAVDAAGVRSSPSSPITVTSR